MHYLLTLKTASIRTCNTVMLTTKKKNLNHPVMSCFKDISGTALSTISPEILFYIVLFFLHSI